MLGVPIYSHKSDCSQDALLIHVRDEAKKSKSVIANKV